MGKVSIYWCKKIIGIRFDFTIYRIFYLVKKNREKFFSQATRSNSRYACKLFSSIALFDRIVWERKLPRKSSIRDLFASSDEDEWVSVVIHRIVVSRILRKSSQRNILYPRVAPKILIQPRSSASIIGRTRKRRHCRLAFFPSLTAAFSSGINLSSLYSSCCILFFPHAHILQHKDIRFG